MNTPAVLYARYSSDNQREESIDAQVDAISKYAKQRNFIIIDEYIDRAKTATSDRRPNFQKLIKDSGKGQFSTVIVHKLDRFARNKYDSAIYKQKLKTNGVNLVSVTEQLDGSPESIILESVLEGMAEYYSQNLAREVRKGMFENAKKSLHTGGRPPLGYSVVDKKLVINEYEAEAVRLIFNRFIVGTSYTEIIAELNERGFKTRNGQDFAKNSLYEILVNQKYAGVYVYNRASSATAKGQRNNHLAKSDKDVVKNIGGCPAIVTPEIFQRASEIIKTNKRLRGGIAAREKYLLSGLVICGNCLNPMHGNRYVGGRNKHTYVTYRCSSSGKGHGRQMNSHPLDTFVMNMLQAHILNPDSAHLLFQGKQITAPTVSRRETLQSELSDIDRAIFNIQQAVEGGFAELAFRDRLISLLEQQSKLSDELSELDNVVENVLTEKSLLLAADHFAYLREIDNFFELKRFIREYVKCVVVYRDSVDVKFKLPNTAFDLTIHENICNIY